MTVLQVKNTGLRPGRGEQIIANLTPQATLEEELDEMVAAIMSCDADRPDQALMLSMALMARCTEIYLQMVRIENDHRKAKVFRTMQLQKVMDLIEFYSRGASRLIEVRRQDVELSR
jgi:hypothetical protein